MDCCQLLEKTMLMHIQKLGLKNTDVNKVEVFFPYLYWDLDNESYYKQHDLVYASDLDSLIAKLKESQINNHDLEDCFCTPFEIHQDPLLLKVHDNS